MKHEARMTKRGITIVRNLVISHSFELRRSDFVISLLYVRGCALRRSPVSRKILTRPLT
jgi:hypothetical protein